MYLLDFITPSLQYSLNHEEGMLRQNFFLCQSLSNLIQAYLREIKSQNELPRNMFFEISVISQV